MSKPSFRNPESAKTDQSSESTMEREMRRFDHQELVVFDTGESYKNSALVFAGEGTLIDFDKHKYTGSFDSTRRMIVETKSGNQYYVQGENIINVRESIRNHEVVYGPANDIPEFEIGSSMSVNGYGGEGQRLDTSDVENVTIQYKAFAGTPGMEHTTVDSDDPFSKIEAQLGKLPVPDNAVSIRV